MTDAERERQVRVMIANIDLMITFADYHSDHVLAAKLEDAKAYMQLADDDR